MKMLLFFSSKKLKIVSASLDKKVGSISKIWLDLLPHIHTIVCKQYMYNILCTLAFLPNQLHP